MILKEMFSLHRKFLRRTIQLGVRNLSTNKALLKNHYETLGVKPDATLAEIKNAYFKLSKIYHPDRIAATDENLEKFREISNAYEILGNEYSRKLYDRGLLDITSSGLEPGQWDDPIVKFYQQKQDFSKVTKPQAEEMDAWTQTYYKEARQKVFKHNELFKQRNKARQHEEQSFKYYFVAGAVFILVSLVLNSNLEPGFAERLRRKRMDYWIF